MNVVAFELLDACLDIFLDGYRPQVSTISAEEIEEGFRLWMQQQLGQFSRRSDWEGCYAYLRFDRMGLKARQLKTDRQIALAYLRSKYPNYGRNKLKTLVRPRGVDLATQTIQED